MEPTDAYKTAEGLRWRFVFRLSDGRRTSRRGFTSRSAALNARAIAVEEVRRGDVRATRDTFGGFCAKVLEAKRPYVTAGTLQTLDLPYLSLQNARRVKEELIAHFGPQQRNGQGEPHNGGGPAGQLDNRRHEIRRQQTPGYCRDLLIGQYILARSVAYKRYARAVLHSRRAVLRDGTMSALRKDTWPDSYRVRGGLDGIDGPGRRTVRRLTISGMHGGDLSALRAFSDLTWLVLEDIEDVDMTALTDLSLETLDVGPARGLDLAPLAELRGLRGLSLGGLDAVHVPDQLRLAAELHTLGLIADTAGVNADSVERLIATIDWASLDGLRELTVRAGWSQRVPPAHVDLGFLTHLSTLERLDMVSGVLHAGTAPSPLEPPFAGLPRGLTYVRVEADDPTATKAALQRYLAHPEDPVGEDVIVVQRHPYDDVGERDADWAIVPSDAGWQTYGSLADTLGPDAFDVEYDALQVAQRRVRDVDVALFERVEWDHEADGTGIYAPSRADLERVLTALEIKP